MICNRCDECGRLIALKAFAESKAKRRLIVCAVFTRIGVCWIKLVKM